MNQKLKEKILESVSAVLPITGIVLLLSILLVPVELVIAFLEAGLYRKWLKGRSKGRAFAYGLAANAASALLGWFLAVPVWQWIVSIS